MKALSGREATMLALLAQNPRMPAPDKRLVLKELDGQALKIAQVIVGESKRPTQEAKAAAEAFSSWANNLSAED